MIGLLNVGSLVLGLLAWALPVLCLVQYRKFSLMKLLAFTITSLSACAVSIVFQLSYNHHLVLIEDWSALMDTSGAVVALAGLLLMVTIILNIIAAAVFRRKLSL